MSILLETVEFESGTLLITYNWLSPGTHHPVTSVVFGSHMSFTAVRNMIVHFV
jgi:hypothetical protein